MKTKEVNKTATSNKKAFISGGELTKQEFLEGIRSAEKGPFYSVQESMDQFDKWLREREKK